MLKSIPIILFFLLLFFGVVTIKEYFNTVGPIWNNEAQIAAYQNQRIFEEKIIREREVTKWWSDNTIFIYSGGFLLIVLGTLSTFYVVVARQITATKRAQDGLFPLIERKENGTTYWINPNLQTQAVAALTDENLNSKTNQEQLQLQYKALENFGKAQMMQGMPAQGFRYAATNKLLAGAYDKPQRFLPDNTVEDKDEVIDVEYSVVPFEEAVKQSDKFNWNVGQYENSNDLAKFNFTIQSHALICGGTNCGKTSSTGFLLALYALRSKMHVVIFDGAGGADWVKFKKHVEFYELKSETLEHIISTLENLYDKRQEVLNSEGIEENYLMKKPMQPIIVIIDEFGYALDNLKIKDKALFKNIVARFQNIIRVLRKVGIHLVIIDQNANTIPQEIVTNIKCIFAYNAEGHIGAVVKRYNLDKLKPQGQFDFNHKVTNTWHTKKFVEDYLVDIAPCKGKYFSVTDNNNGGGIPALITTKPSPSIVTSKNGNTPVTSDKTTEKTDNESDKSDNKVITALSLKGPAITTTEKDLVYKIYVENGKKKNQTCKQIWGGAGGYLKYLNSVIEEYESE